MGIVFPIVVAIKKALVDGGNFCFRMALLLLLLSSDAQQWATQTIKERACVGILDQPFLKVELNYFIVK